MLIILVTLAACGDDDGTSFDAAVSADAAPDASPLDELLPPVPAPDGTARATFAGAIGPGRESELIPGPARSGLVGDTFMRNARARFVIQAPGRSIGIVPYGGNVVDAVAVGGDDQDHFGELGLVYLLGRTCEQQRLEVLRDGSGGGAAVVRAIGRSAVNDYVNIKGIGFIPVPVDIDPDIGDAIACATTYTLEPDSPALKVAWTLYNPGPQTVRGPIGMLNDIGGDAQVFAPVAGFMHLGGVGFDAILGGRETPVQYQVYQGPGVAYGLVPRLDDAAATSASVVISGAATLVFGLSSFLQVFERPRDTLVLAAGQGVTVRAELVVGRDGAAVEEVFRRGRGEAVTAISGQVRFQPSDTPARARVVLFRDVNGNGTLEANDFVVTYLHSDADGGFAGAVPPAEYLVIADVPDVARSAPARLTVGDTAVVVPPIALQDPAQLDFSVVDDADGRNIPAKLTVVGRSPVPRDYRFNQDRERRFGLLGTAFAPHGTSMPAGSDPGDAPLRVPAGGPYRVYVSRGPEWSVASLPVTATAGARITLPTVRLRRVLDTTGYVATAFHEHALGSPDSPVPFEDRLASLVAEGIEFFAGTDHDRLTDYDPLIDAAGLRGVVDAVVGVETTPFAYGHFNGYPLDLDDRDPTFGAVDWARGQGGFAMLPGEIFEALRERGAEVVQVCHPRDPSGGFQGYFRRAGLVVDYDARTLYGDAQVRDQLPAVLRLPDTDFYSDDYDALEVWNSLSQADTDGDGVREQNVMDLVLRDYLAFLSLGKVVTPLGNGDTHDRERSAAGMPRTLVRVPDDSPAALAAGLELDVWDTMVGAQRDVVVTNGPMITVTAGGVSAIGKPVAASGGEIELTITAQVPAWTDLDTVEIFANSTPDRWEGGPTALRPFRCFTTREDLHDNDPCLGAGALDVTSVDAGGGEQRREARVTVTVRAADIPRRAGATGDDAWIVVRARGTQGMFPVLPDDAVTDANLDAVIAGDLSVMAGRGVGAMAFTAPVFVDFDGGGWRAPFAP
jgi:hypothetical protein